ncbi:calcium/sodium antiporter [Clostridium tertium]|uniref:calcium/sodium antiporter n=1 Tax=Clostridium tertium TaxID=1559 RepID=UPI00241C784B|nr:calcium/sodium antiporter [Clostridium tertium]
MSYLILIIGFILLIKGADIFVDGAAKIAKKFGIPSIIVGLTIVSLGTSAPELSVSLIASFEGNNGITIGNVLGSNIFNTLMVLGVTAIIMPIVIKKNSVIKDYIINIVVSIVLLVLAFGRVLLNKEAALTRISGIILLILCIIYTLYLIKSAKSRKEEDSEEEEDIKILSCIIKIILGIIGIIAGGNLVVSSASDIAYSFGLSDKLVGLTIVAVGTSLPELVTTMIASIKGENDIAIGNVLGSNIFNILLILGVSSSINAIPISSSLLIVISIILGIFMFKGKKDKLKLDKLEGLILVLLYIVYMIYIISRN